MAKENNKTEKNKTEEKKTNKVEKTVVKEKPKKERKVVNDDKVSDILKNIDDIAFCNLTSADVVRHPLVQKIVKAYEEYEKKAANKDTKRKVQKLEKRKVNGR